MSSKRWLGIAAVLLAGLAIAGAAPSLQKERTEIHLYRSRGQTITITPSDQAYLTWGWGTCSYGLTVDWITYTEVSVSIYKDGELVREIPVGAGKWDEPFQDGGSTELCLHGDGNTWRTAWRYDKLNLRPGEYQLVSAVSIPDPLTDGYDYEPDGTINVTPARSWNPEPITLIVTTERSSEKVCVVNEPGGSDSLINRSVAEGAERAARKLHVELITADAEADDELGPNIEAFANAGDCDLIIGVGFRVGFAMGDIVGFYPDQQFAILDFEFGGVHDNVAEVMFLTEQASFLAGYVAAGISETGKVGVFGGLPIEPVTRFMDGYALGVERSNADNGTSVEVLGWDLATQTGLFTFNFGDPSMGQSFANDLYNQGADTVFPVAGVTGFGVLDEAALRKAAGESVRVIGVDFDYYDEFGDPDRVVLTSVVKDFGVITFSQIEALVDGRWEGGTIWEGLETGAVYIAPFHKLNNQIPGTIKNDLKDLREGIINGSIPTRP